MHPGQYLIPYLASNAVAVAILGLACVRPRAVRWVWVAIFVWAATVNAWTATHTPWAYLAYAALTPSAWYRTFIEGWFSRHIPEMVLAIAAGQLVIATLLARNGGLRRLGVAGAIVFLLAIAPLGIGSGFPFSLTAAASLLVMERHLHAARRIGPSPASTFVPAADTRDEQATEIRAPAHLVFETAQHVDLLAHPLVAAIMRVRSAVMGDTRRPRPASGIVAETRALGWGVLHERRDRALVMGAVARPWARDVTFRSVAPDAFAAFSEPNLVKIAWTLEVEPLAPARTRFRTETRVAATDDGARRAFRRYWTVVSPGIRVIRWAMLRTLRREAERRYRQAARTDPLAV